MFIFCTDKDFFVCNYIFPPLKEVFLFHRVLIYSKITFAILLIFFHVPCIRRIKFLFTLVFYILVNSLLFLNLKKQAPTE